MDIDLVNDVQRDDDDDDDDDDNEDNQSDENEKSKKAADVEKVLKKAKEVAKKKVARRPRPKLDIDRLTGSRGLEELCNLFKDEKFKGKGYEFADLETLMHKFEYWAHRLVPHLAFDDFIEKAEILGGKKSIKNKLQQMRDKLNVPEISNCDEQASHTLLDLLPTINADHHENQRSDIPDDDELNELFQ